MATSEFPRLTAIGVETATLPLGTCRRVEDALARREARLRDPSDREVALRDERAALLAERKALRAELDALREERDSLRRTVDHLRARTSGGGPAAADGGALVTDGGSPSVAPDSLLATFGTVVQRANDGLRDTDFLIDDFAIDLKADVRDGERGLEIRLPGVEGDADADRLSEIRFEVSKRAKTDEMEFENVPDLVGKGREAALRMIREKVFEIGSIEYEARGEAGDVLEQFPSGLTVAKPGTPIDLVVSSGGDEESSTGADRRAARDSMPDAESAMGGSETDDSTAVGRASESNGAGAQDPPSADPRSGDERAMPGEFRSKEPERERRAGAADPVNGAGSGRTGRMATRAEELASRGPIHPDELLEGEWAGSPEQPPGAGADRVDERSSRGERAGGREPDQPADERRESGRRTGTRPDDHPDPRRSGADAGRAGADAGHAGADAGRAGADPGRAGADPGRDGSAGGPNDAHPAMTEDERESTGRRRPARGGHEEAGDRSGSNRDATREAFDAMPGDPGRPASDPSAVRSQFETLQESHQPRPPVEESGEGDDRAAEAAGRTAEADGQDSEADETAESPGRFARLKSWFGALLPGRGGSDDAPVDPLDPTAVADSTPAAADSIDGERSGDGEPAVGGEQAVGGESEVGRESATGGDRSTDDDRSGGGGFTSFTTVPPDERDGRKRTDGGRKRTDGGRRRTDGGRGRTDGGRGRTDGDRPDRSGSAGGG